MFKLKNIFCGLAALSACALMAETALAVPETEAAETSLADGPYICGDDTADAPLIIGEGEDGFPPADAQAIPEDIYAYTDTDIAPDNYGEIIAPPYDPYSGELPPAESETREIFYDYEKGSGDIENIKEYWENNGYPEYVSFICDQGVVSYDVATQTETFYRLWEIGIADISEEKEEEIKSLVSSEQHLFFTPCNYSLEAREEIKEKIKAEYPLASVSLSEYSEEIEVVISKYPEDELDQTESDILAAFGAYGEIIKVTRWEPDIGIPEIGLETAVPETVPETAVHPAVTEEANAVDYGTDATEEEAPGFISDDVLPAQTAVDSNEDVYGISSADPEIVNPASDQAVKEADAEKANNPEVSGAISEIGGVAAMINKESQRSGNESLLIWFCAAAAAAAVITAAVILGRRRSRTVSLADGRETSENRNMTKSEIIKAVEESVSEPSDKAFGEIVERIKEEEK